MWRCLWEKLHENGDHEICAVTCGKPYANKASAEKAAGEHGFRSGHRTMVFSIVR